MSRGSGTTALVWGCLLTLLMTSCTGSDDVNAAFLGRELQWFVFHPDRPDGWLPLGSIHQLRPVAWRARPESVRLTDGVPWPGGRAVLAVSHLGLLVVSDQGGPVRVFRPAATWSLSSYRTGALVRWNDKVFVELSSEANRAIAPIAVAWWEDRQSRVAAMPIPSILRDPLQQALHLRRSGTDDLEIDWWSPSTGDTWSTISLSTGMERQLPGRPSPMMGDVLASAPNPRHRALQDRWGQGIAILDSVGGDTLVSITPQGSVAVEPRPHEPVKLYRLPDLGPAGRYTLAVGLAHHLLVAWEMTDRAFVGASGVLSVPWSSLVPSS